MNTKEALRLYLLKKLQEMEAARSAAGKAPSYVSLRDYHDAVMDDMREELALMGDHGTIEYHQGLNTSLLHLSPENCVES